MRKQKRKEKRENNTRLLKKKLDKVFSDYIRQRDNGVCFTCGDKKDWKEQQCGHYISRSKLSTRWNPKNCHCQCVACNIFKKGNYPAYTIALENKFGFGIVQELEKLGREIKQWTAPDLMFQIDMYLTRTLWIKKIG